MRKTYDKILKKFFYEHLILKRMELNLSQAKMAENLLMDTRSYVNLDHGKSGCSALTLALYLIYCCDDANTFLNELRCSFEDSSNHAS